MLELIQEQFLNPDPHLDYCLKLSASEGLPFIQVAKSDGRLLEVLTKSFGVKNAVEVGTLGGYSAICIARGLEKGGHLYTLERYPEHAKVARASLEFAGLSSIVTVIDGDAKSLLSTLSSKAPFDMIFIDAEKQDYLYYLEWSSKNLRTGGILLADNVLAWGLVADPKITQNTHKPSVHILRKFNELIASSKDFRSTLLPTLAGLSLSVKLR